VANDQRRVIYQQRNELMERHLGTIQPCARERSTTSSAAFAAGQRRRTVDIPGFQKALAAADAASAGRAVAHSTSRTREDLRRRSIEAAHAYAEAKVAHVDREAVHHFERAVMLQTLDNHWREHLANLDHLRQGIHLRGYAQKNPKQEYKREAFELFSVMLDAVRNEVTRILMTVQIRESRMWRPWRSPSS
jgi:preprotein translocase subunit SecA